MSKVLTDFQEHEGGQLIIDNANARWVICSQRMGTVETKVLVYMLMKGGRAYVIACSAAADQFPEYKSKFEEVAQSFKFE